MLLLLAEFLLQPLPLGDVPREAPGVDELPVPPEDVGADEDAANRAVLAAKAGLVGVELLVPREPPEDVRDDRRVGVELGDVPADVLLAAVAEQLQLGPVRPEDRPVRPDPMQADGGVLDEVGQLLLLLPGLLLGELPLGDVAEVRDDGPDGGLFEEVRDPALDPPPRAVLVPEPRIDGQRRPRLLEHLGEAAANLLDVLGMNLLEPVARR